MCRERVIVSVLNFNPSAYRQRILDSIVQKHLHAFGAVEIAGTMWSGKTWTALAHARSNVAFDDSQSRNLALIDPDIVLQGDNPRLIDEWQEVPEIWDRVRRYVDRPDASRGMFILTGSSRPNKAKTHHTGAGRISRLKMWPMSLAESGDSDSSISLRGLFEGSFSGGEAHVDLRNLAHLCCRGGWPASLNLEDEDSLLIPGQYVDTLTSSDDKDAPEDARELMRFLTSTARNIGGAAVIDTFTRDLGYLSPKGEPTDSGRERVKAMRNYFLNRFVLCELFGWDAPIKSPQRLRTKPKLCFADPSLAATLLGVQPDALLRNAQLFGQLFEELCLRDLRVYASALPEAQSDALRYYRDADGLEVDAIIELKDGRWGAFEIKLGHNKVDAGAHALLRLRNKIRANPAARNPEPSFLAVLVGKTDYAYRTQEGVFVVPITKLGA